MEEWNVELAPSASNGSWRQLAWGRRWFTAARVASAGQRHRGQHDGQCGWPSWRRRSLQWKSVPAPACKGERRGSPQAESLDTWSQCLTRKWACKSSSPSSYSSYITCSPFGDSPALFAPRLNRNVPLVDAASTSSIRCHSVLFSFLFTRDTQSACASTLLGAKPSVTFAWSSLLLPPVPLIALICSHCHLFAAFCHAKTVQYKHSCRPF